jgi:hypothetical protein
MRYAATVISNDVPTFLGILELSILMVMDACPNNRPALGAFGFSKHLLQDRDYIVTINLGELYRRALSNGL